ncbi:circadian clock protein KaiC [Spiribacter vilamensis]|uniref:Circadian clock protein KaiC n=1 Tax=Spiribacter vilamensis TaxID=531306 RepID=A0A4Q8CZJ3_9GAMM|nr:ATPase domain-containing protein [Spiribacter vilamensis]RZU98340.1 circadian clock protein KaiC [Spiribacter vilamensis]
MEKRRTGIADLDRVTNGGLPTGQATLVLGEAAAGKTVLALQVLAHSIERGEGAVFVSFEESPAQIRRDAASFSWGQSLLESDRLQIIDARPPIDSESAGNFDLDGLLSVVAAAATQVGALWIVFDGIDQLLQYQPDHKAAINQIRRVEEACEQYGWTLLLTGKATRDSTAPAHLEGVEFLLSASLVLSAQIVNQQLNRSLRIAKYRGSDHTADEMPMLIDRHGITLPYHGADERADVEATNERLSLGVERLDTLLGGGIYRGSSLLISGRPGTAKSTLAGAFAEAAAARGERTLYISFDELEGPYVRNLESVGINLREPIEAGWVCFRTLSAYAARVTEHFLTIRRLLDTFEPHCLVIDPISAMLKASATEGANMATEQLLDLVRRRGITTIITSLSGEEDPEGEATQGQVSTLADSWIVLDYNVRAGERNRSLSIVKSRGTGHSNQQRELLIGESGPDLADIYENGSEVLMGTARVTRELEDAAAARRRSLEWEQRRTDLEEQIAQAEKERRRLEAIMELEQKEHTETSRLDEETRGEIRQQRDPDRDNPTANDEVQDRNDGDQS